MRRHVASPSFFFYFHYLQSNIGCRCSGNFHFDIIVPTCSHAHAAIAHAAYISRGRLVFITQPRESGIITEYRIGPCAHNSVLLTVSASFSVTRPVGSLNFPSSRTESPGSLGISTWMLCQPSLARWNSTREATVLKEGVKWSIRETWEWIKVSNFSRIILRLFGIDMVYYFTALFFRF